MNVDRAMNAAAEFRGEFETEEEPRMLFSEMVAVTLAAEVERLRAEVQRLDIAGTHSCHDDCLKLPCVQRREIERLKAELSQLRKDWCDDDEAIKQQALRVLDAAKVEGDSWSVPRGSALAEMMADEIGWLRADVANTEAARDHWFARVVEVQEKLAAAKAASVVPVRVLGIYETEYPSDVYIECRTGDDCETFRDWLRERMKGGEG